mmetsp:Transcript_32935/g.104280  ORF Transcript_32935/g.104280 Transcript_32935/m.104280 type:complete len:207 (+) Transcript_32935:588-1208(+)
MCFGAPLKFCLKYPMFAPSTMVSNSRRRMCAALAFGFSSPAVSNLCLNFCLHLCSCFNPGASPAPSPSVSVAPARLPSSFFFSSAGARFARSSQPWKRSQALRCFTVTFTYSSSLATMAARCSSVGSTDRSRSSVAAHQPVASTRITCTSPPRPWPSYQRRSTGQTSCFSGRSTSSRNSPKRKAKWPSRAAAATPSASQQQRKVKT